MKNKLSTKWGIIIVGVVIGVLASLLQFWGNPANMGICVACFVRDITGALGSHRGPGSAIPPPGNYWLCSWVPLLQHTYLRNLDLLLRISPICKFFLRLLLMIGALIFLGCPWRAVLRLAGGDWNAILGLLGLAAGIWIGTRFLKGG